ncbi:hypothetical protein BDD26_2053 [Xenorhabdus cabanillasii]|uniref:Uncharacterized protein n=1 Tax=Xenorhabdus cabanillasii TaxID=351673 RepID=A0A3D9UCT9_9GAMM|nr:hypothetical protein BDD26_2053 [Xenorhabdus cabanillasii]
MRTLKTENYSINTHKYSKIRMFEVKKCDGTYYIVMFHNNFKK